MFNGISTSQIDKAQKIYEESKRFAMPVGLEEKCMGSKLFKSKTEYETAEDECKRWLALCIVFASSGIELGMASEKVDEVWHQFILFSLSYHKFCEKFNRGCYLHHIPNVSQKHSDSDKRSVDNFKEFYRACFGELNAIWPQGDNTAFSSCETIIQKGCSAGQFQ